MIKFFNQHKLELVILFGLVVLYFVLRVPNLTLQPIFADEAIYVRWAQVMKAEPTLRFLPLSDGKTPFFMWAMIPLFKIFSDPLVAGRLLSVLSGFLTFSGAAFLGWRWFGKKVGLWSALFIAITPMFVFFDRMALVDSLLAAFSIWSLNFALLLIRYNRLDLAMILGYLLGGGLLTKTPAMVNLLVLPTTILTFNWSRVERKKRLLKVFGLWVIGLGIGFGIYNLLRLGPGFDSLNSRNQDYIFSVYDLKDRPLDPFIPHLRDLADWLPKILTMPLLATVLGGIVLGVVKRNRYIFSLLAWSMFPLIIEMAFFKTFTARYILYTIPPLLVVAAYFVNELTQKIRFKFISVAVVLIMLPLPLNFDHLIVTQPQNAPLPKEERKGYLEDWTAGYGLKEVAQFLTDESNKKPIVVGTEGNFGTLPEGLQIYLDKNRNVSIVGGKAEVTDNLRNAAKDHPTFFVANKSRFPLALEGMELIKEYPKAKGEGSQDAVLLFRIFR